MHGVRILSVFIFAAFSATVLAQAPGDSSASAKPASFASRGRENLVALARMYHFVRFNHPSERSYTTNWDRILPGAVRLAEAAQDDAALVAGLEFFIQELIDPKVHIQPINAPPPAVPPGLRTGPEVTLEDTTLYIALSPGDCCPTTIPQIEAILKDHAVTDWVLDLRETQRRSFGSIFSEVKVTIDWLSGGPVRTPPRTNAHFIVLPGGYPEKYSLRVAPRLNARAYDEGPGLLEGLPFTVIIDETMHPGAAGWLLGLQMDRMGTIVGTPSEVLAEAPFVLQLSPTLEVSCSLTEYTELDMEPRGNPQIMPDRWLEIPTDACSGDIVSLIATEQASPQTPKKSVRSTMRLPKPTERARRIADVMAAFGILSTYHPYWDSSPEKEQALLVKALEVAAGASGNSTIGIDVLLEPLGDIFATLLPGACNSKTIKLKETAAVLDIPADAGAIARRPGTLSTLSDGIAYIDLTRIDISELQRAWSMMGRAQGIIVDLRGRTGVYGRAVPVRYVDEEQLMCEALVPLRAFPDTRGETHEWNRWLIKSQKPLVTAPTAFLTNQYTVGWAERIADAARIYGMGTLCGQPSGGNPGERYCVCLPSRTGICWTAIQVLNSQGNDLYGHPLQPDILVEQEVTAQGQDAVIAAAVQHIQAELAKTP